MKDDMRTARAKEIREQINELQQWFANKPYGWRERASEEQLRQWEARSDEYDRLNDVLADLVG